VSCGYRDLTGHGSEAYALRGTDPKGADNLKTGRLTAIDWASDAMPGFSATGACDEGSEDVGGVAIERSSCSVVSHRRPRIGV